MFDQNVQKAAHQELSAFVKFPSKRCTCALNENQLFQKSEFTQVFCWEPTHLRTLDCIISCEINLSFSICEMVRISTLEMSRKSNVTL